VESAEEVVNIDDVDNCREVVVVVVVKAGAEVELRVVEEFPDLERWERLLAPLGERFPVGVIPFVPEEPMNVSVVTGDGDDF